MAKSIVVCLDGTWNKSEQQGLRKGPPTNVLKLFNALKKTPGRLEAVYLPGVGTRLGQKVRGGAFGYGLFEQIKDGYDAIVDRYEPGDSIFLFGFSRGAFCARSLAGFIGRCGVLRRDQRDAVAALPLDEAMLRSLDQDDDPNDAPTATDKAFVWYKLGYDPAWRPALKALREKYAHDAGIAMIGVFDTVGALGIPEGVLDDALGRDMAKANEKRYAFLDTALSKSVAAAYHAVAIDEHRKPFLPTLWQDAEDEPPRVNRPGTNVEQVWFCGAHSNVGGGYPECGLSDIALEWMASRAMRHGLEFAPLSLACDPCDTIRNSLDEFLFGIGRALRRAIAVERPVPPGSWLHRSVRERIAGTTPAYGPVSLRPFPDEAARYRLVD